MYELVSKEGFRIPVRIRIIMCIDTNLLINTPPTPRLITVFHSQYVDIAVLPSNDAQLDDAFNVVVSHTVLSFSLI